MGRTLASRAHPQRTVGLKRQSVPRAGKLRKRNTPVLPTAALDSTGKRRRAKPHRSEADLELARRMLEAGVTFVKVNSYGWDSHGDNFNGHLSRVPKFDH